MLVDVEDDDVGFKPPIKKRDTKTKGKKLSVNEKSTDRTSSKRNKKEETLKEGIEENSQKINSPKSMESE